MSIVIRLKRGNKAAILNSNLQVGEPAFALDTNELIIQGAAGKIIFNSQFIDNADKVDGYHASRTPTPNTIPVANSSGKLDPGWIGTVSNSAYFGGQPPEFYLAMSLAFGE